MEITSATDDIFVNGGVVRNVFADAKEFPKSDFNSSDDGDSHTCSRWHCDKPATQYRNTGQGQMWACAEHADEMKKDDD